MTMIMLSALSLLVYASCHTKKVFFSYPAKDLLCSNISSLAMFGIGVKRNTAFCLREKLMCGISEGIHNDPHWVLYSMS